MMRPEIARALLGIAATGGGLRDPLLRVLFVVDFIASRREPFWRWTAHLAAAIALVRNGVVALS